MKMSKLGGAPMQLAGSQSDVKGLVVDATSVYWVTGNGGAVMKVPLDGGVVTELASGPADYIAVDATHVYWTSYGGHTVMRVPLGGGAPSQVAATRTTTSAIAVDATSVYWVDQGTSPNFSDGAIMKLAK